MGELRGLNQDEMITSWALAEQFDKLNPVILLYALNLMFTTKNVEKKVIWGKMLLGMVAFALSSGDDQLANHLAEGFRELLADIDFDFYSINMQTIN